MPFALAAAVFLLAGCAAKMSKDECRTVDWRTVGYEDGSIITDDILPDTLTSFTKNSYRRHQEMQMQQQQQ